MSPAGPDETAVGQDLASARFAAGVRRGHWRVDSYKFPLLVVAVAGVEPDGRRSEYFFHFELTGFPGTTPAVVCWDPKAETKLPPQARPKGSPRVNKAFQSWGSDTVYRPWERSSADHNNFARDFPDLAWNPSRDLTFILEDLHGLLTSNALARSPREAS